MVTSQLKHCQRIWCFNERSKDIDRRLHFIRECKVKKKIDLEFIKSHDQDVDIFTKSFKYDVFQNLRMMHRVVKKSSLQGGVGNMNLTS